MDLDQIIGFAQAEIEPVTDLSGSPAYRCSAYLKDGLYLPCVLLASSAARVALASRRFDEARGQEQRGEAGFGMRYQDIVRTFVASGNRINDYDIERVEKSRFAIPLARLREVRGETRMSWTQFAAVMSDGQEFSFGTTYLTEFFDMPPGYTGESIATIIPHKRGDGHVFRERPFFTCYTQALD